MKYDPKMHSQVHPAHVKPVHVGWYRVCYDSDYDEEQLIAADIGGDRFEQEWLYWDGRQWLFDEDGTPYPVCHDQQRRWFGLREKP